MNDFQRVFNDLKVDLLVTPTCFHDTATFHEYLTNEAAFDEKDFFTACANIAGLPAITLPACLSKSGLPVGIQLIGILNLILFWLELAFKLDFNLSL